MQIIPIDSPDVTLDVFFRTELFNKKKFYQIQIDKKGLKK